MSSSSEQRLELYERWPRWQPNAWLGRLGERDVVVLLGAEGGSYDKAASSAVGFVGLTGEGVLPLLEVLEHDGRIAWVYERAEGIGLGLTLEDEDDLLPSRAAAEVVARVAEILRAVGEAGLRHPGPEPRDVLVSRDGTVRVTGFTGPHPPSPAMRPPDGGIGEEGLSYRIGALLAWLVGGSPPVPAAEEAGHASSVRRVVIKAMARPGPVLSNRYADWLRGLLAFSPSQRPVLSTVPDGLRQVGEGTGGLGLQAWLDTHFDVVVEKAEERPAPEPATPKTPVPVGRTPDRTTLSEEEVMEMGLNADLTFEQDDDPTVESSYVQSISPGERRQILSSNPATIPVAVGPPAEEARRRPSLPPGFLDPSSTDVEAPTFEEEEGVAAPGAFYYNPVFTAVLAAGLIIGCLLMLVYLI